MSRRTVVLLSLTAIALGVLGAALAPGERAAAGPTPVAGVPAAPKPPAGQAVILGTPRVLLRAADPHRGAPWALRALDARASDARGRGPGAAARTTVLACAQLGRIVQGRFGWIDATGRFRATTGPRLQEDQPVSCTTRTRAAGMNSPSPALTTLTGRRGGELVPVRTVAWGQSRKALRAVAVTEKGRPAAVSRGRDGTWLAFTSADPGQFDVRVRLRYANRTARTTTFGAYPYGGPAPASVLRHQGQPIMSSFRVDARAPDPSGGAAWGTPVARSSRGGYCRGQAGRIVGRRIGQVNEAAGTFAALTSRPFCGDDRNPLTAKRPLQVESAGGNQLPTQTPSRAAIERRLLPGLTLIAGTARPEVKLVEIVTSRDVRTIAPTGRAHTFLTVYDGDFPTGNATITAITTTGERISQRFGLGF